MDSVKIPKTVDEYIADYPAGIQEKLIEMRSIIRKSAPDASEKISYRMPSYIFNGILVYFAAHTKHLGFYPFPTVIEAFKNELTPYHTSKGGIQFPYKDPLPIDLIKRIVGFRVKENIEKAALKKIKKIK
ncbi:MAG: DUF1801 domain-containing protein [Bacteroidales bacterium]|nr:DUF1801 domain-containing protein [Bacteroidales bacterium]MBK8882231.1 DUF1801 domain-containing protein [Bacteroidales bacterium]